MIEFREELLTDNDTVILCPEEYQREAVREWLINSGRTGWEDVDINDYMEETIFLVGKEHDCYASKHEYPDTKQISYEEALKKPITVNNTKADVEIEHVGKYDLYEVLSFVQELLQQGYKVSLKSTENAYVLKGTANDRQLSS